MNNTKMSNSDSDVSESNSWTVLCECEGSDKPDNEKFKDCKCAHKSYSDLVIVENNEFLETIPDFKCDNSDNENQNLVDHETIHHYENNENLINQKIHSKCRSKRRRREKGKSYNFGTLFIIGTVLAIAGTSLLCLLTPKNVNLKPSTVNNLQEKCSKLSIVKDAYPNQLPIKTTVNTFENKLNIQDKDCSLQTYLVNHGFTANNTNSTDADKSFSPATYQQFQEKIEAFNNKYAKPSSVPNRVNTDTKQSNKSIAVLPASTKVQSKLLKPNKEAITSVGNIRATKKPLVRAECVATKTQLEKEEDTMLQYKIVCSVLQDLALLRLTQLFARQLADKAQKRKKKLAVKAEIKRKISLKQSKSIIKIKKHNGSNTSLMLWDELPFNTETPSKHGMGKIMEEVDSKTVTKVTLKSKNRQLEKNHKRQIDYLEKLKQEHNSRMAYLKGVRERQQKSIQALIQERKQDFKKLNVYNEKQQQHIMEGRRRLLEINDYYRKLKNSFTNNSIPDFNYRVINSNSDQPKFYIKTCRSITNAENNRTLKTIPTISRKNNLSKEKCKSVSNFNSTEHLNLRKKYYEQIAGYWLKREEYLNARIKFMKEASGSLKEVMCNYRKTQINDTSNNKCVVTSIVNKASLVFSDNNLQRLKSETRMVDVANSLASKNSNIGESNLQINRYCSLQNFDNK